MVKADKLPVTYR